jgi:crotonobetainyl-CoA:carnitine CoA-transferase CaiB-like acyl-CoA transferase
VLVYPDAALGNIKIQGPVHAFQDQSLLSQKKGTVLRKYVIYHLNGVNKNVVAVDLITSSSHPTFIKLIRLIDILSRIFRDEF